MRSSAEDVEAIRLSNMLCHEEPNTKRKVLIINTRGWQSDLLQHSESDTEAASTFFVDMLARNDDLHKPGVPAFDVAEVQQLKLSADQTVEDRVALAKLIEKHYDQYCGFVIQNGSDSICRTACALSFMLENLGKPVVFTGSLIPGDRIFTDMKRNTILALLFASCNELCEVSILFDEKLFRGCCAIRVNRGGLKPFDSPHVPPIGYIQNGEVHLHRHLLLRQPRGRLRVMSNMSAGIVSVRLGPSVPQDTILETLRHTSARAVIILGYGSGNGPSRHGYMKNILSLAMERKLLVVVGTQNRYGAVDLGEYEVGRQIMDAGATGTLSLTWEAQVAKLKYLFGLGLPLDQVRQFFGVNLRGEFGLMNAKL